MKTQKSTFRSSTCFHNKIIFALTLIKLLAVGFASTEIYASGLTVSPTEISETYEPDTTNQKTLSLTNNTGNEIEFTVSKPWWVSSDVRSGTLSDGAETVLNLNMEVYNPYPFSRPQKADIDIRYTLNEESHVLVVPIEINISKIGSLWDLDGDRFPGFFEEKFGTSDDPLDGMDIYPVYSTTQDVTKPKYFRVDDDLAEETTYEKKRIQAALDAAEEDGSGYAIIEVLPGVYLEDVVVPESLSVFLFANNSFELAHGDEAPYVVVDGADEDSYGNAVPVLSIRANYVAVDGLRIAEGDGIGISVEADYVLIESCQVYGNASSGIRIDWSNHNIKIQDSSIYGNQGRGIRLGDNGNILVKSCEIYGNITQYSGGGIAGEGDYEEELSNVSIEDSRIYNNSADRFGGGISLDETYGINIKNSLIYGNSAQKSGGAIHAWDSDVKLTNSIVFNNKAEERGGGISSSNADFEFVETTLLNNNAKLGSEAYASGRYEDIKLINSIVWNYKNDEDTLNTENAVAAENSVIQAGVGYIDEGGVSNEDPKLTALGFLTKGSSVAIDQVTSTDLTGDIHDEVRPHPSNGSSDIGADEFVDSDSDGLPDFWVEQYFGDSPVDPVDFDADGDTLTTLEEYIWGMNPSVALFQGISFNEDPINDGDSLPAVGNLKVRLDNEPSVSSVELVFEDTFQQTAFSYVDDRAPFSLAVDTNNITDSGEYLIRVRASNHQGEFVEETRTVQIGSNKAPAIESIDDSTVIEGDLFSYQVNATDSDGDGTLLSYSISASPEVDSIDLEISGDGFISFDTSAQQDELAGRDFTITVTVTDTHPEEARVATESFNLRVQEIITFENQTIEDAIRVLLNMTEPAQIIETDLQSLSGIIDLSGLGVEDIEDLAALKYATNITGLNLSGNSITDLTSLSELTQFVTLDLSNNQISEISALPELTNLATLNLSSNLLDLDAGDEDAAIINQFVEDGTAVDSSGQARFSLDISVIGGGTVSRDPDQVDYGYADEISLTATPEDGNLFAGWSGDLVEIDSETTYEITSHATITAEFAYGIAAGNGDGLIVDTYRYRNSPKPDFSDSFYGPGYRSLLDGPIFMSASIVEDIIGRRTWFSCHLFGELEARYTGSHKFYIPGEYYVDTMVYLNGEEILYYDNSITSERKSTSDSIDLVAGQTYEIKIFYRASSLYDDPYVSYWSRSFYVGWEFPDGSREQIPKSQLHSGYEFTEDDPAFASAVVAKYFDAEGNAINLSGSSLGFGIGTLPLNSKIELSAGEGESIRYTLDGSEPTAASRLYTGEITISSNTTLKARAYSSTATEGATFTGVYTLDDAAPVLSDLRLPDVDASGGVSTDTIRVGDNVGRLISINVQDESSITDVRFYLTNTYTEDTIFLGSDEYGTPEVSGKRFDAPFNIFNFEDGDWILKVVATDLVGNDATFEQNISVEITQPDAPVITQPEDDFGFANGQITISGSARIDCRIQVEARLVDGDGNPLTGIEGTFTALSNPLTVSSSGEFSMTHTFTDNRGYEQYELRAVAIGRNNLLSAFTETISISVDSSIPPAPINLNVTNATGGDILISWDAPLTYSGIIRAYRIQVSDNGGDSWMLVNEVPGHVNSYVYRRSDQIGTPPYVFRVLSINAAGTATLASEAQITEAIVPDEIAPQIIRLEWISQNNGQFDADDSKYGPGLITAQIEVNEAVTETPYFALVPPGLSLPYKVDLIAITDRKFEGVVAIEAGMPSGDYEAFAVLSDFAGNQSRSDDPANLPFVDTLETSLTIDTETPQVSNLSPASQSVFKNAAAETMLSYTFTFDEALQEGYTPIASAEWGDGSFVDAGNVTLQELGADAYQVDVKLAATDGYDGSSPNPDPSVEQALVKQAMLTVLLEMEDKVGNSGFAEIPSVLIYRNMLPQVAPPVLAVTALPEGKIRLEWEDVPDADRYQLMRVDSSGDEALTITQRDSEGATIYEYTYTASSDGEHSFYVFGEREDPLNPGTYVAGYSLSPISVTADSAAPSPANTVEIEDANPSNPNEVLRLDWQHPDSREVDHFDVYRTDTNPTGATEVSPSWDLIQENLLPDTSFVFDSQPFAGESWYIVVATDAVGNEVLSSNFDSIDITIVPPAEVKVTVVEGQYPVLSWSVVEAVSDGGSYSVYYQDASGELVLLEADLTDLSYTDVDWDGGSRKYWIESVKGSNRAKRDIFLSNYDMDLVAETVLYRGLPTPVRLNRTPSTGSWNFQVRISESNDDGTPEPIYSGELNKSFVNFGLNADGSDADLQDVTIQLEMWPKWDRDLGESVCFEIQRSLPVKGSLPILSLQSDVVSRGSTASNIELLIDNPSESSLKVQFSKGHAALKLYDTNENLLSQTNLVTEADRTILGKDSLSIEFLEIEIPENAPETVILQAELLQYSNSQTGQRFTPEEPVKTRLALSTVELSYTAEVTTPKAEHTASLLTGESLEITGRAIDRNGTPRAAALVTLGLENGEFKRTFSLVTDSRGEFSYVFNPDGTEPGGAYTIWAKHPELARTPDTTEATGTFTYKRITVSPEFHTVRIPRNYTQGVPITVDWPEDTTLSDFTVEIVTFDGEDLPLGLSVTVPSVADLAEGETALEIIPQILPLVEAGAPNEANLLFRISAKIEDATEATVLGEVPVYCYFSQTFGQLTGPSKLISLSVLREIEDDVTTAVQDDNASFSFTNTGLIPLTGLQFDVMQKIIRDGATVGYEPAPKWLKLMGALPEIFEVGESIEFQLITDLESQPEEVIPANGTYGNYVILAKSKEAPTRTAGVELNITSDSSSGLEVHVINAYFGFDASTLPDGGASLSIPAETLALYQDGIPNTKITLQQDDLSLSTGWVTPLIYKGTTGEDGKVSEWTSLATGVQSASIPSGRYQITVEAPKHDVHKGVIIIKPGVTSFEQVPLSYGAVTVEWEVREITLQDRYEVTVETIFETEVPAPVVTTTPAHVELPDMCPGDVFEVELIIENHGIISALDMENPIPDSDEFLQIEPLVDLGESFDLPAQQSVRVAYRCICIKALPGSECN